MLHHNRAFFIFGGYSDSNKYEDTIARLDAETKTWSKAGSLKNGRYAHGAIFDGEKFIVVGGYNGGAVENEVCTLIGTSMSCEASANILDGYWYYPELFLVPENFGKDFSQC